MNENHDNGDVNDNIDDGDAIETVDEEKELCLDDDDEILGTHDDDDEEEEDDDDDNNDDEDDDDIVPVEGAQSDAVSQVLAKLFQVRRLWDVVTSIMRERSEGRRKKLKIVRRQCRSCAGTGGIRTSLYEMFAKLMPSLVHGPQVQAASGNDDSNTTVNDDGYLDETTRDSDRPIVPYNEYEDFRNPKFLAAHAFMCGEMNEMLEWFVKEIMSLRTRCDETNLAITFVDIHEERLNRRAFQLEEQLKADLSARPPLEELRDANDDMKRFSNFTPYSAGTIAKISKAEPLAQPSRPNHRAVGIMMHELNHSLSCVLRVLEDAEVVVKDVSADSPSPQGLSFSSSQFRELFVHVTRLEGIREMLPLAISTPLDDLMLEAKRPELPFEEYREPEDTVALRSDLESFNSTVDLGAAAMLYARDSSNSVSKWFKMSFGGCYFGLRSKEKQARANMLRNARDLQGQLDLWQMPDSCLGRATYPAMIPSVRDVKEIMIPRRNEEPGESEGIHALFLSGSKLTGTRSCMDNGAFSGSTNIRHPDQIIVHFHGGGFVSMSAFSHQNYTRQWANRTGIPVLSVDYRLAPDHPYPAPLDDCYDAYRWVVESGHIVLGTKPRQIFLAGDSSGGSLAVGVIIRCIQDGFVVPDGALLAYPALTLVAHFSPSIVRSLDDSMIPYSFVQGCKTAYLCGKRGDNQEDIDIEKLAEDPLVSVSSVSDSILEQFPPIRLMVADLDIFHDECVRFAYRLWRAKVDCSLNVYGELPHGFLSMDTDYSPFRALRYECHKAVQDSVALLSQLAMNRRVDEPLSPLPYRHADNNDGDADALQATDDVVVEEDHSIDQATSHTV